ncbi:MAG TPA: DUF4013 domain-containing protein [Bacteroidota bacterium]
MMQNLGISFTFPFKDQRWLSKFLLAALFMLLSILVVGIFFLLGYYVQVIQRVIRKDENPMPEWDEMGEKFVLGFKYFVVYLVYLIPVILLYVLFLAAVIAASLSGGQEISTLINIMSILLVIILLPYTLALSALTPIISARFAATESISEALDIAGIVRQFKMNWQNAIIVALITVGIQSFAAVGLIVLIVGIFFTLFYSYLASAHMAGLLYLDSMEKAQVAQSIS